MVEEDCKTNYETLPFYETGYFSKTICDYLKRDKNIAPFYHNFSHLEGFKKQLEEKRHSFHSQSRTVLVEALKGQYKSTKNTGTTEKNIQSLAKANTFTVTTGHQLNLFTGPLYFLYKIVSTINLAKKLKSAFPKDNFVPVYWMATEDHDFDEINYFNYKGKKIRWNSDSQGAVGRFATKGLDEVFATFSNELGTSEKATELKALFKEAYLGHKNLTDATRFLANKLFGTYGLVILDGDDTSLKKLFAPFVKDELLNQTSFKKVTNSIDKLGKNYPIQVNPREINLFYLDKGLRERIVFENDSYKVVGTEISWTREAILKELSKSPERFSPNVITRPLYQEVILPNLCYIGGGGELAYWFQLKSFFETVKVPFPILLLRNSVLLISEKQQLKLEKLKLSPIDLFQKQHVLVAKKIKEISALDIDFSEQRKHLKEQFKDLHILAKKTDESFLGAVKAQEKKQLNGLDYLEKRLLKAEKRKHKEIKQRIVTLQDELFPNHSLEERQRNFSEFYLEYGQTLIEELLKHLDPLKGEFSILSYNL